MQHRNFVLIWAGMIVSNIGTWMQNVAQSWLIYKMTGNNPLYLGWLGLAFALPMSILPPLGGVVADRVDRRKLLFVTQSGMLGLAALLSLLTFEHAVSPRFILAIAFCMSVLLAFDNPARQSLIPELVPRAAIMNAISINSATYTGAALVGPALAGALLDVLGPAWLFLLNAISYLAVLAALALMREVPARSARRTGIREALLGGFSAVWNDKVIRTLLVLSTAAALFARSYQQLLPVFADGLWHAGPRGYGALLAAGGGGALAGAFAMSLVTKITRGGRVVMVAGASLCVALCAFSLAGSLAAGVLILVAVGIASTVFTTIISTWIQLRVAGELRGRVISLFVITLIGLPALGALLLAATARGLSAASHLGAAAGAPRALVFGALLFFVILMSASARLWRARD